MPKARCAPTCSMELRERRDAVQEAPLGPVEALLCAMEADAGEASAGVVQEAQVRAAVVAQLRADGGCEQHCPVGSPHHSSGRTIGLLPLLLHCFLSVCPSKVLQYLVIGLRVCKV